MSFLRHHNWQLLAKDFYLLPDALELNNAREKLCEILILGQDPLKGFHHPFLKPNRFHARPRYPVKAFMCLGKYWNPLTYTYEDFLPFAENEKPHVIPQWLQILGQEVLIDTFPHQVSSWKAQTVLVNYYKDNSHMGLHKDKDEKDLLAPVVGVSFGSTCRFHFEIEHKKQTIKIPGNSVYVFGDSSRLMSHGVSTIYQNTLSAEAKALLYPQERVNLTLRKVDL